MQEHEQVVEHDEPDFGEISGSAGQDEEGSGLAITTAPAFEPFSLTKERVLFQNLNIRTEKHGDESEPACDIKLVLKTSNSILKKLKLGLLEDFYTRDRQGDVEDDFLRKLKYPQMGPVSWDFELPRATLRVHDADDGQHDVVLAGGKANKFKLNMLDGGTVELSIRCQFSQPDEEVIAKLMRVLNQNVPISLATEAVEEEGDNFQQAELLAQTPKSAARLAAEQAFAGIDSGPDDLPLGFGFDDGNQGEELAEAGIAESEGEEAARDNVTPLKARRKRAAAGAE